MVINNIVLVADMNIALPIQESEQIHDTQKRYDMPVYLVHQATLSGVRRTGDIEVIIDLHTCMRILCGGSNAPFILLFSAISFKYTVYIKVVRESPHRCTHDSVAIPY